MNSLVLSYMFFFCLFIVLSIVTIRNASVNPNIRLSLHLLFIFISIWFFSNCMVQLFESDKGIWFWHEIKFIGVYGIPATNLYFTMNLVRVNHKVPNWVRSLVIFSPVFLVLMVYTNHWTHYFRKSYFIMHSEFLTHVFVTNAIGFYVGTIYCYITIAASLLLLIWYALKQPKYYRVQPILLILGILVPIIINVSFIFNILNETYDYTILGFSFTGLVYYISISYFKVPDIIPLAREIIVNDLSDIIIICDLNNHVVEYNEKARKIFQENSLIDLNSDYYSNFDKMLESKKAHIVSYYDGDIYEFTSEKGYEYYEYIVSDIKHKSHTLGQVIKFRDITQNYTMMKKLETMATIDPLTGLFNRNYFSEFLSEIEYPIGIIYGGLNSFKLINESFGSDAGDTILKNMGEIFKQIAPESALVGRYEGDEFLIVLPKSNTVEINSIKQDIEKKVSSVDLFNTSISICLVSEIFNDSKLPLNNSIVEVQKSMERKKLLETRSSRSSIIESLRLTLEQSDYETKYHTDRTAKLATMIGEKIGLSNTELSDLEMLATLHDIGKVAISDSILLKPDKLTEKEFEVMKTHTQKGYQIAISSPDLLRIADGILHHHEKYDGSGYPDGLIGEDIPLESRIITLVDSYDVMVNERPYKKAMTPDDAILEILRCKGKHFDPNLSDILIEILEAEKI